MGVIRGNQKLLYKSKLYVNKKGHQHKHTEKNNKVKQPENSTLEPTAPVSPFAPSSPG